VTHSIEHLSDCTGRLICTKGARNKLNTGLSINADREVLISGRGLGLSTILLRFGSKWESEVGFA
jgi:hypothetical protein